jgi:signal transduction histidine kinase
MERAGWKGGYDINVTENLQSFQADRRVIKRIFLNLLSNAIEFMAADGKKLLSASASSNFPTLKISDIGIGIAKRNWRLLTDPFVRGDHDPFPVQEGNGLVLAVVKLLFEPHSDELSSDS